MLLSRSGCQLIGVPIAQPGDVVGERGQRELRRSHLESVRLEALDDAASAGPVGPGAVNEDNVGPAVHPEPSFARSCGSASLDGAAPARIARSCDLKLLEEPRVCSLEERMPTVPARPSMGTARSSV